MVFGLFYAHFCLYVRLTGLEPARRETLDPKSSASTNSATGAFLRFLIQFVSQNGGKVTNYFSFHQKFTCKFYDCIFSLTKIVAGQSHFVVRGNAKFYRLSLGIIGGAGRKSDCPAIG